LAEVACSLAALRYRRLAVALRISLKHYHDARKGAPVRQRGRHDRRQAYRRGRPSRIRSDPSPRTGRDPSPRHLAQATYQRLTAGRDTPERCIDATFWFLLDRESKESILSRFDVTVISRYFPEFERELPRYLSRP